MLIYRVISGVLMVAGAIALFWLDGFLDGLALEGVWQRLFLGRTYLPSGLALLGLVLVLIPLGAREVARMCREAGVAAHTAMIALSSIAACLALYATPMTLEAPTGATIEATVLVAAFLATLIWHSRRTKTQGVIAAAGATMFAIALLGLMPGFYLALRRWHAPWVVLAIILITKSCDIGAYFTGRFLGRHKLIPWLSPKKTWEGLAGGVALAVLVAVAFAWISQNTNLTHVYRADEDGGRSLVPVEYSMTLAALAGLLFALVGHAGDLMVSLLKRDAGVKDSGQTIPGFGGLLDVLDSPLLVAPVAYWMVEAAEM